MIPAGSSVAQLATLGARCLGQFVGPCAAVCAWSIAEAKKVVPA